MPGKRNYSAYRATNKAARSAPSSRYRKRGRMGTVTATRGFAGNYGTTKNELKAFDIAVGSINVSTTGAFSLLHLPALGTDYNQRIGRKTLIKKYYIRGRAQTEASAQSAATTITTVALQARAIVLIDKQPNGLAPATTDLLVSADPASQLNLNNRDRFKILADRTYEFDPYANNSGVGGSSMSNQIKKVKLFKKWRRGKGIETIFNATNGGTIADINSGALYLFLLGSSAAGTNTDINFTLSTRVRYSD